MSRRGAEGSPAISDGMYEDADRQADGSPAREITNADLLRYINGMDRNVSTKLKKVQKELMTVDKKVDSAVEAAQSAQKMAADALRVAQEAQA
eukprot:2761866-Pyramimonas_sp.AAC.1